MTLKPLIGKQDKLVNARDIYNLISNEHGKMRLFRSYYKSRGTSQDEIMDLDDFCKFFYDYLPKYTQEELESIAEKSIEPVHGLPRRTAMLFIQRNIYDAAQRAQQFKGEQ